MYKDMLSLAVLSLKRKKQNSILMISVLFLSFSFAVIALSVTESINKTNQEYCYNTYGTWEAAVLDGQAQDDKVFQKCDAIEEIGVSVRYGVINGDTGIGTVDDKLVEMGRIRLQQGRLPQKEDEIAVEADVLSALGYNYEIGQEVVLPIEVPAILPIKEGEDNTGAIWIEKTYILCGVVKEYTDLWYSDQQILTGAFLTEAGVAELVETAQECDTGASLCSPCYQFFFKTSGNMKEVFQKAEDMQRTCIANAYANEIDSENNYVFYVGMIFVTTIVSVVCIYLLQIRKQVRQYALFRSIGVTKKQLKIILLYETLCLTVPAILAGIAMGVFGTWLILEALIEMHSTQIYVRVSATNLVAAAVIWCGSLLAVRMLVFQIALKQPLIGRIQINNRKERRYCRIQSILSILLSVVFSGTLIVCTFQFYEAAFVKEIYDSSPSYTIHAIGRKDEEKITKDCLNKIERLPGIRNVNVWMTEKVDLVFQGIENCELVDELRKNNEISRERAQEGIGAFLFGIREEDWKDYFDFSHLGIDEEKFREGSQVIMLFPVNTENKVMAGNNWYDDVGIEEGNKVTLNFYGSSYQSAPWGNVIEDEKMEKLGAYMVEPVIVRVLDDLYTDQLEFMASQPYTILCSDTAFQKMLHSLPEGYAVNDHLTDGEVGYSQGQIYTTAEAGYLSTDYVMADLCEKYGIQLYNSREANAANIQEATQKMVQILTCGGSVILIAWLILWNTLTLSAGKEKKKYGILRALGMGEKQIKIVFVRKAAGVSMISVLAGWTVFAGYLLLYGIRQQKFLMQNFMEERAISVIMNHKIESYRIEGINGITVFVLTAVIGCVIACTYYFTRKKILKNKLLDMLCEEE